MNMSYCRFQNTLMDLNDCFNAIEEEDYQDMDYREERALKDLFYTCEDILDHREEVLENLENKDNS